MSEVLTINGKKLLPIKEVIGRTKYTRDYVAKLARERQIVGVQVGRQWFIDEQSLSRFIKETELEVEVRKRQLSRERRREREIKVGAKNRFDIVAARPRYGARRGMKLALAVMVCGVLSGYVLYASPDLLVKTVMLQKAQPPLSGVSVVTSVGQDDAVMQAVTFVPENSVFSDTHEARRFGDVTEGVLLVPTASTTDLAAVSELFSDPVVVNFSAPGVGVVSLPGQENHSTTSVSFVTVPVSVATHAVSEPANVPQVTTQ